MNYLLSATQFAAFGFSFISVLLADSALLIHRDQLPDSMTVGELLEGSGENVFLRVPREGGLYRVPHRVLKAGLQRLRSTYSDVDETADSDAAACGCGQFDGTCYCRSAFAVGKTVKPRAGLDRYVFWHNRLHVENTVLYEMAKSKMVDIPLSVFRGDLPVCAVCAMAKVTRRRHARRTARSTRPGQLVCADVCYVTEPSRGGARYALLIVDDYSCKWWVMCLKRRSEVPAAFTRWLNRHVRPAKIQIESLRTDRGGEFDSSAFSAVVENHGINHQFASTEEHQENGVAERNIRSLEECIRTRLIDSGFSAAFWAEAAAHSAVTHNATPTMTRGWKTPNQLWDGLASPWDDLQRLRRFGTPAIALRTSRERGNDSKLQAKGAAVRILGYDSAACPTVVCTQTTRSSSDHLYMRMRAV